MSLHSIKKKKNVSTVYNQKTYNMKVCIPWASLKYTLTLSSWRAMSPSYAPALLMPCSSLITSQNCKQIETLFSLKLSQNIFSHLLHFDLIKLISSVLKETLDFKWQKQPRPSTTDLSVEFKWLPLVLPDAIPFFFFYHNSTAYITLKFTGRGAHFYDKEGLARQRRLCVSYLTVDHTRVNTLWPHVP